LRRGKVPGPSGRRGIEVVIVAAASVRRSSAARGAWGRRRRRRSGGGSCRGEGRWLGKTRARRETLTG